MNKLIRSSVTDVIKRVINELHTAGVLLAHDVLDVRIEATRDSKFGDVCSNIPLLLSRDEKKPAREIAKAMVDCFNAMFSEETKTISRMEIGGPGFINIFLGEQVWGDIITDIIMEGARYGTQDTYKQNVLIEFVSANPTGPLTLAHGRQAAVGDAIANILESVGYKVAREFYLNDAGRQIELLGKSVWTRYMGLFGHELVFPEDGYQGSYIKDIASMLKEQYQDQFVKNLDPETLRFFSEKSASIILEGIKEDLSSFGISFDRFFSETEFRKTAEVEDCLRYLKNQQYVYEHDGATWFRSQDYGDDKDRVLVRSNGQQTYFCPDIAYHRNKLSRGFDRLIDIWGPDHHGYIPRMKAALRALGLNDEAFDVIILQLATLYEGDTKLSMSTRKGEFVTLRQIVDEVGMEVTRYFFLMRRTDSHLDFDLALAKKHSMDNPVYYIQYAYARIASIFREYKSGGGDNNKLKSASDILEAESLEIIKLIGMYPDVLDNAAAQLQPNILTDYLQKLAGAFHSFYAKCRVLTDDEVLTISRLRLIQAVQTVIKNGFALLGISAPQSM